MAEFIAPPAWFARFACGAGVLLALSLYPRRALASDDWWGPDKAKHFGVSAALAAGGYGLGALLWKQPEARLASGGALALTAGIAKELWDLSGHGSASFKDLAWDGIGTGVGLGFALTLDLAILAPAGATRSRQLALALAW